MQLLPGLTVADRFRLVRELGRGGMGCVWLAEHIALDVRCAVKFIDRERNNAEMRARFEQEAKAAASLRSPYVVQILDYGIWGELPYLAMEYLHGEDLGQRLERELVLSPADTFRIVNQVGKALSKAHAAGIVHRDLKPENIFLVSDDDEELAKVLDFGIAKREGSAPDDTCTRPGLLLGTPFYMSPEQAHGHRAVDHRSDLWSLAVITYQCLTGHLPFSSEGLGEVLSQILNDPLPRPSAVHPDLPPDFDHWWNRAAERDPDRRFQSAKELTEALAQSLELYESIVVADISNRTSTPDLSNLDRPSSSVPAVTQAASASPSGHLTDGPVSSTLSGERRPLMLRRSVLAAATVVSAAVVWFGVSRRSEVADERVPAAQAAAAPFGVLPALSAAPRSSAPPSAATQELAGPIANPTAALLALESASAAPRGASQRPAAGPPSSSATRESRQTRAEAARVKRRVEPTNGAASASTTSGTKATPKRRVDFGI